MGPRLSPPFPSRPSPYRRLGAGAEHPVRVQMIIALVAGLVLVAVPLYLWRRPEPVPERGVPSAVVDAGGRAPDAAAPSYGTIVDAAAVTPAVKLGPFKTLRCADPGPGKTPPERCDHITFFEDALTRAIRDNGLCAPSRKAGVTVSFVLEMDFRRKRTKLFWGKSSSLPRGQLKELFGCVERALPSPDWGSIPHQHARYVVSVPASYPPSDLF
ncbi:MAG: hypothetical protein HY744_09210 [Deltaproteobacteria bacterium]|nr:hypothetical protein [Deltaproteobacteria bacterium]